MKTAVVGVVTLTAALAAPAVATAATTLKVTSTSPARGATRISILASPTATFSARLSKASYTLTTAAGKSVATTSSLSGRTLKIAPRSHLASATKYVVRIKSAKDTSGHTLASAYSWSFQTQTDKPPTAALAASPKSGTLPLAVHFDASASTDNDQTPIANYNMNWGDGTGSSGPQTSPTFSHSYTKAGSWKAVVTVRDTGGQTSTASVTITVQAPDYPPAATLSVDKSTGDAPLKVAFDASGSTDTDATPIASYAFAWGDGTAGSGKLTSPGASHTYQKPGSYKAVVTVTDTAGKSATASTTVTVTQPDLPPAAMLSVDKSTGLAPLAVNLDASSSTDADATPIASYSFDFGDGSTRTGTQKAATAAHTYSRAGTYKAVVTVTDTAGKSSTASTTVTVSPDLPPAAALTVDSGTGDAPLAVAFDASGSTDTDGTGIASYAFAWGDGTAGSGVQASPRASHTYTSPGAYQAVVTVTDTAGNSSTASTAITITERDLPPAAALTVDASSGPAPLAVSLDASASTDGDATPIASYAFDFGDGSAGTGDQSAASAAHTYSHAGTFTAVVTITDTAGKTATASATVTVSPDLAPAAALSVDSANGDAPLAVTFDASGSTDSDGTGIDSYAFAWGDGSVGSGLQSAATAQHTYTSPGSYQAVVTVTDTAGNSSTASTTVTVTQPDLAPAATLSVDTSSGVAPLAVNFDASTSTDADATPIATYAFDFGDGSAGTGDQSAATAAHTYSHGGTFKAVVTITDTAGKTSTASTTVTVSDPPPPPPDNPPAAALSVTPTSGQAPLNIVADATASTDADATGISRYSFNWGDGTAVATQAAGTAQHTYTSAGTFTVTVTVTDTAGNVSTATSSVAVTAAPVDPPAAAAPTTVALTFDDGTAGQDQAAQILAQYGMHGTFYVNSGRLGMSDYLTVPQLRAVANAGNEIAGHTTDHADLTTLTDVDITREVCDDRVALHDLGFQVTDFAYPFGAYNATIENIVQNCGYNSARIVSNLRSAPYGCTNCVTANPIPPTDPYAIKTNTSVRSDTTLAILESYVTQAEQDKGGLVPIVWHHLGTTNTSNDPNWMSLDTFAEFVQWLSQRPSTTVVKTMAQVIGGTERPYVAGPPLPTQSPNLVQNYSLEEATNGIPTGFQTGSAGTNTATWTYTTDAHTGGHAERVDITDFVSGDRKLVMRQDASTISPAATPGHTYLASVWGKGTGTAAVVMFYRSATDGSWKYWQQSPTVRLGSGWTQYNFTTVALPAGANAISFGLALTSNGSETVDDFGLLDQG